MHAHEIISTHPQVKGQVDQALMSCIEECYDCGRSCIACADACMGEPDIKELTQCIRINLDCADMCFATGAAATRRTAPNNELLRSMMESCVIACRLCAEECERHAEHHEHCRLCAEACRRCEQACQRAVQSAGARH